MQRKDLMQCAWRQQSCFSEIATESSDIDLLVTMLKPHEKCCDPEVSRRMAEMLLGRFGSLSGIFKEESALGELVERGQLPAQFPGEIERIKGFVRRILRSEIETAPVLDNLEAVKRYCRGMLFDQPIESLLLLLLDNQFMLTAAVNAQSGTSNHVNVYPREILRHALRHDASFLILVHNHPSGVAQPSVQDIMITQHLVESFKPFDLGIADHIITAKDTEFSFRENGLLTSA